MASKTDSQAVAFRISSVFDRGARPKQLWLYSIFVWRLLLHLSHRKNTSELDVLVRLRGPSVFQNTQGRKTGCTDLCGHALCRMLCASTFSTARPTLSMCNSGRVSTKRQRQKAIEGGLLPDLNGFYAVWGFARLCMVSWCLLTFCLMCCLIINGPSLFPHHLVLFRVFQISPCELPH